MNPEPPLLRALAATGRRRVRSVLFGIAFANALVLSPGGCGCDPRECAEEASSLLLTAPKGVVSTSMMPLLVNVDAYGDGIVVLRTSNGSIFNDGVALDLVCLEVGDLRAIKTCDALDAGFPCDSGMSPDTSDAGNAPVHVDAFPALEEDETCPERHMRSVRVGPHDDAQTSEALHILLYASLYRDVSCASVEELVGKRTLTSIAQTSIELVFGAKTVSGGDGGTAAPDAGTDAGTEDDEDGGVDAGASDGGDDAGVPSASSDGGSSDAGEASNGGGA